MSQSSNRTLVALIQRFHLYIGLFIGPLIFIAALSGSIYVLLPELEQAIYRDVLTTEPQQEAQPLAAQIAAARQQIGVDVNPVAVRPAPNFESTTRVMFAMPGADTTRAVFINPETLAVTGDMPVYGTSGVLPLLTWVDFFHRHLQLGHYGRIYSEMAATWMWIAAVGGLLLWFLRHKGRSSNNSTRRWHIKLGISISLFMLFFSATGLTWSNWAGGQIIEIRKALQWVTPFPNRQLESATPLLTGAALDHGYDTVFETAREEGITANKTEILPPRKAGQSWVVREIDRSWPTRVDAVAVDAQRATITDRADFADYSLIAKLIRWGIDAHMGVLFGLPNRIVLVLFGLSLCSVIVLGYRLALKQWRRESQSIFQLGAQLGLPLQAALLLMIAFCSWLMPLFGPSLVVMLLVDHLRCRRSQRARG